MDWNYLKKILQIFLGALLVLGGLWLLILSFSGGFEITLAFLAFFLLCGGVCATLFGVHALQEEE